MIDATLLAAAGLADAPWATPPVGAGMAADAQAGSQFWDRIEQAVRGLPAKPARSPAQQAAVTHLMTQARAARDRFLTAHTQALYRALTDDMTRFRRLDDIVYAASWLVPGLVPSREQVAAESAHMQADKDGAEIDQGILLAHILADPASGRHLCHAMLLARPEAAEHLPRLERDGAVHFATASVTRRGKAVHVELRHPRFLNAEDDATLDDFEIATDLAALDPGSMVAVLRGGVVAHPKYAGRRIFSAGINLTDLYQGRIPFLWYIRRDLGPVNKLLRGIAAPGAAPDGPLGASVEKPWIAAVDTFAIGGGCQLLLVMDYVLAGSDAFMTLPARKEGIIPGAANLRLPRFTGERIARQAISNGRRLDCDTPEGRMICDEIARPHEMDAALERLVDGLTNSGAVSLLGNRRAFRIGAEPLDSFRAYMSVYCREQATCHFSPQLIANLETHWRAHERK